jgi:hypothetical protein
MKTTGQLPLLPPSCGCPRPRAASWWPSSSLLATQVRPPPSSFFFLFFYSLPPGSKNCACATAHVRHNDPDTKKNALLMSFTDSEWAASMRTTGYGPVCCCHLSTVTTPSSLISPLSPKKHRLPASHDRDRRQDCRMFQGIIWGVHVQPSNHGCCCCCCCCCCCMLYVVCALAWHRECKCGTRPGRSDFGASPRPTTAALTASCLSSPSPVRTTHPPKYTDMFVCSCVLHNKNGGRHVVLTPIAWSARRPAVVRRPVQLDQLCGAARQGPHTPTARRRRVLLRRGRPPASGGEPRGGNGLRHRLRHEVHRRCASTALLLRIHHLG